MIQKISHIGIAVQSLEEQTAFYRDVLKMKFLGTEEVAEQKVKVAFFEVGDVHIELLAATSGESPIAKFIEAKGQGIHHIAYETENITEAIAHLKENKVRMIDETPKIGAHSTQIAFIHPKASFGVLTELCCHPKE